MEFYNYLLEQFGYNEVIFSNEISFNDYSEPWIKKAVARLCEEERLIRFDKGVYYIPTDTILGKSKLDPRKVITDIVNITLHFFDKDVRPMLLLVKKHNTSVS